MPSLPQETHSIFSVELGNLEAHTEAVVRLSYLGQLERVAGTLEYCHTATWVPPYTGSAGDAADGPDKVRREESGLRAWGQARLLRIVCVPTAAVSRGLCSFYHLEWG